MEAAEEALWASGAAARLIDGLADLQAEIARRRLGLMFLLRHLPHERNAAQKLSRRRRYCAPIGCLRLTGWLPLWDGHPEVTRWQEALSGLIRDAEAQLP
jgi:hypothetical protein